MHKGRGLTLLEIIIATIILSLTILGLLGVFVAGNNWVLHFRERATSAELGKLFVDPLQTDVRQDTWVSGPGNALTVGTTYCDDDPGHIQNIKCPPADRRKINKTNPFTVTYTVGTNAAVLDELRRVSTTVNWTEAATTP